MSKSIANNRMKDSFVLSISFGNYLKGDGGTDKVIAEHQKMFNDANISYIQIAPLGRRKGYFGINYYTVVIDGKFYDVLSEKSLLNELYLISSSQSRLKAVYFHHFLKLDMAFVEELIQETKAPVYVYIHDFYTVCEHYRLINSHGEYCGEGHVSAEKCYNCSYYENAVKHYQIMHSFFYAHANRLSLIFPSESAASIWKNSYSDISITTYIVPHQDVVLYGISKPPTNSKLSMSYIGKMIPTKGSSFWNRVVSECYQCYDLYYFGNSDYQCEKVKEVKVTVTPDYPDLMQSALEDCSINIAILWSTIPETYSYTYYEASSAGCFIITNRNSGNIAQSVIDNGNGRVFSDEETAINYLLDVSRVNNDIRKFSENIPKILTVNQTVLKMLDDNVYSIGEKCSTSLISNMIGNALKIVYLKKHKLG